MAANAPVRGLSRGAQFTEEPEALAPDPTRRTPGQDSFAWHAPALRDRVRKGGMAEEVATSSSASGAPCAR